ncbi:MAG: M13 family metallopeptidase [Acidobacteriota bacterium]|nr:M13 family metallopeptidase [Acidobacteriota bacterium]
MFSRKAIILLLYSGAFLVAQTSGVDLGAIDRKADPCNDFYQYACGTWVADHPVPPDQSRWSRFNELQEKNQAILRGILDKSADPSNKSRDKITQEIGDFYAACMDEKGIEARGTQSIQSELDRVAKLSDKKQLAGEVMRLHRDADPVFFRFAAAQDAKDSTEVIANVYQGGLGLPDRDYYLKTDPKTVELRNAYEQHVRRMFALLGHSPERAAAEEKAVLSIETALAKSSLDRVSLRDPNKRYHKMPVSALNELAPAFDWRVYLAGIGIPPVQTLNVGMPDFLKGLEGVLDATSLDDLKAYMTWHILHKSAELLPEAFVNEDFAFFGKTLTGAQELKPRWKRCVTLTDSDLGEALGQKFVEQAFGKQGKERTLKMVGEIEKEMAKDIDSLTWMSAATKQQALTKLHGVANKIGYPEKWKDYGSIQIKRDDALGNDMRSDRFAVQFNLAKIGKPVDKLEWGMTPPTVNAYYNPPQNNINFPAGILQAPFYYSTADDAVNYGAIGAVVGHELTHGFDDQGRQFDATGNLRDWWTANDAAEFKTRADCIANEYGGFSPIAGVNLNGRLTLGENAADNGGLRLAYMALMDSLAGKTQGKIDGYTPEQRFFVGWGQVWCENQTEQSARLQAQTNPHSPGRFRANGTLQNMPEFGQAFGCKVGQPMMQEKGCRVW